MLSVQPPSYAGMERLSVPTRTSLGSPPDERGRITRRMRVDTIQLHNIYGCDSKLNGDRQIRNGHHHYHHSFYNNHHNNKELLMSDEDRNNDHGGNGRISCSGAKNQIDGAQCPTHVALPDSDYGQDRNLQIRTPYQQSELMRSYIRPPPNKSVSDVPDPMCLSPSYTYSCNSRNYQGSKTNFSQRRMTSGSHQQSSHSQSQAQQQQQKSSQFYIMKLIRGLSASKSPPSSSSPSSTSSPSPSPPSSSTMSFSSSSSSFAPSSAPSFPSTMSTNLSAVSCSTSQLSSNAMPLPASTRSHLGMSLGGIDISTGSHPPRVNVPVTYTTVPGGVCYCQHQPVQGPERCSSATNLSECSGCSLSTVPLVSSPSLSPSISIGSRSSSPANASYVYCPSHCHQQPLTVNVRPHTPIDCDCNTTSSAPMPATLNTINNVVNNSNTTTTTTTTTRNVNIIHSNNNNNNNNNRTNINSNNSNNNSNSNTNTITTIHDNQNTLCVNNINSSTTVLIEPRTSATSATTATTLPIATDNQTDSLSKSDCI